MGCQLEEMRGKVETQEAQAEQRDQNIRDILRRLDSLEAEKGRSPVWRQMQPGAGEEDRGPAVIVGGWNDDTEAEETALCQGNREVSQWSRLLAWRARRRRL